MEVPVSSYFLSIPNPRGRGQVFTQVKGKTSCYNALARERWSIENQLHRHLDVTFKAALDIGYVKNLINF